MLGEMSEQIKFLWTRQENKVHREALCKPQTPWLCGLALFELEA